MAVVGLDLGCLNAVVAQAERGGVTVLLNENSKRLNSCMVSFQGKQRFIGEAAASIARSNYKNTVSCIKRFIGRKFSEPELQAEISRVAGLKFCEMADGYVGVEISYDGEPKQITLQQCAAMMIFQLSKITAASNNGTGIADCVVSVPAWFTNAQRLAMLDACEIAGVRCLRLMHDTTATALEYGIWRSAKKAFDAEKTSRVMFVDVGYSSFQVSVVDYVIGKLVVKATTFDRTLGGRDFDLAVAEWIAGEFRAKHKCDPMSSPKPRMKLLDAAEKAKKTLSPHGVSEANVYLECLMNDLDFSCKLTLEKFEELVAPLLQRMMAPVDAALAESGTTDVASLHSIEICGGGSRVASVKRVLAEKLGTDKSQPNYGLKTTLNADECVSKGLAMQAAILSPRFKVKEYQILEAAPFAVSLSWPAVSTPMDESADGEGDDAGEAEGSNGVVLFPRNGETPAHKRLTFRRGEDFTITAAYDAGAAALLPPGAETTLGEFTVKGVPPGASRVRVNVSHDVHGTVTVASAQLVQEVPEEPEAKPEEKAEEKAPEEKDAKAEEKPAEEKAPEPEAKPEEAAPKKKRKYKKTPLEVAAATPPKMTRAVLDACLETEAQMANQDRVIQETNDMRNELEAYIYKMRDEVIGDLRPYVTDGEKEVFEKGLQDAETWLYEGDGYDATKSQYASRLKELQALGNPPERRREADGARPALVAELQAKVEALKTFANSTDEAYAHIDDGERAGVRDAAAKASDWLMEALEKQGALEKCQDPYLLPSSIKDKLYDLDQATRPTLTKPKPKPKAPEKKEEPAAADPPPAPDAEADAKPDAEMPDAKPDDKSDVEMPDAPKIDPVD